MRSGLLGPWASLRVSVGPAAVVAARRQDERTDADIRAVFGWANVDSFWQSNILSPAKLRKQFDQLNLKRNGKPKDGRKMPTGLGQRHPDDPGGF